MRRSRRRHVDLRKIGWSDSRTPNALSIDFDRRWIAGKRNQKPYEGPKRESLVVNSERRDRKSYAGRRCRGPDGKGRTSKSLSRPGVRHERWLCLDRIFRGSLRVARWPGNTLSRFSRSKCVIRRPRRHTLDWHKSPRNFPLERRSLLVCESRPRTRPSVYIVF